MELPINHGEREDRLVKLSQIKDQGISAYPAKSNRDTLVMEAINNFDELLATAKTITLGGRLRSTREHGNISFADLEDKSGNLQLVLSKNEIGADDYKNFVKLIDNSDFIEATGTAFITKAGEKSLLVKSWRLLTKALRSIPDAHFGLKNEEEKFRKRYLDIILNPEVRDMIIKRDKFWNATRTFLKTREFIEVETPILETMPGGAEARPFITHHNALDIDIYLRIAPELWLKRLMVAGFDKVFEIGRVFRNEGIDAEHAQDYTVMEFYWGYADYNDGMKFVEEMYKHIAMETFGTLQFSAKGFDINLDQVWEVYDFVEIVKAKTGIDPLNTTLEAAEAKLQELDVKYDTKGMNLNRAVDTLWKYCRKQVSGPGFLINVPVFMEPLAKRKEDNPELVDRFQVILAGSEMGKGFSELNDPIDQAGRFSDQADLREAGDDEAQMNDTDFVEALEYGMPPTCGFGFSERLFWFLMNKPARECQIFPLMRPKTEQQITNSKQQEIQNTEHTPTLHENLHEIEGLGISYEEAKVLLNENIKDPGTIKHCRESEVVMRAVAKHLGANETADAKSYGESQEEWGIIGLLHDIDWEQTKSDPNQHCVKAIDILKEAGGSQFLINTIISHCYGAPACGAYLDKKRTSKVEHLLAASETVTGLVVSTALVRPDKKLAEVELASLIKKYKNKAFAANCDRAIIAECEQGGIPLEKFLEIALEAIKSIANEVGI
jgi:lysyl-tRNA synthetase class 2